MAIKLRWQMTNFRKYMCAGGSFSQILICTLRTNLNFWLNISKTLKYNRYKTYTAPKIFFSWIHNVAYHFLRNCPDGWDLLILKKTQKCTFLKNKHLRRFFGLKSFIFHSFSKFWYKHHDFTFVFTFLALLTTLVAIIS